MRKRLGCEGGEDYDYNGVNCGRLRDGKCDKIMFPKKKGHDNSLTPFFVTMRMSHILVDDLIKGLS